MGYQQNDRNYNNNNGGYTRKPYNNNRQDRPRNKTMTFSIQLTGITLNDRNYNIQSAIDLIKDLQSNNVFSKLSVPIQISRATIDNNPEIRGNMNIGYIKLIDDKASTADIVVYANCADRIENMTKDLAIVPRLLIDRDENVITVLGFDLVQLK